MYKRQLLALCSNDLKIELESSKVLDPYEDPCLLNFSKFKRHVPGASKKKIKRIERTCVLYQLKEDGTILARRNEGMSFTITIPKPENRLDLVLKEHELTHFKTKKILDSLTKQNFYWKNMEKFIHDAISICDICIRHDQVVKVENPAAALTIDNVFDRWGIDIVGGLALTDEGYCSILVVVEYLTKFAWAFPLKTKSASEIAAHLTTLICPFGPPLCLLSDSGKEFLNMLVDQLCARFNIIKRHTSAYNPKCNGQCERTNQTLTRMLVKHADEYPKNWPNTLNIVLLAYRTSIHASTKDTPFHLLFGRKFNQFENYIEKDKLSHEKSIENRYVELKKLFDETHEKASQEISKSQEKQVNAQNNQTKASNVPLMKGETVYAKNCKLVKKKGEDETFGPYKIKDRNVDSGNYILEDYEGNQVKESFPRWKLKLIENFQDTKKKLQDNEKRLGVTIQRQLESEPAELNVSKTSTNYSIIYVQKIGRGFSYQIKYDDGSTEWIPGKNIDQDVLNHYNKNLKQSARKPTLLNFNKIFVSLIMIFTLISSISSTELNDRFKHCQSKEINRIVNPFPDCIHPLELKQKMVNHVSGLDELLNSGKFPSTAFMVMKNKYYINTCLLYTSDAADE